MKKNKILLVILGLLILITIVVVIFYLQNSNEEKKSDNTFIDDEQINYYNEETSYYDYYNKGTMTLNINEFAKLPENYLEYKISGSTEDEKTQKLKEIVSIIIEDSEIKIPNKILNGYYGDLYKNIKTSAENEQKTIDEYIQEVYKSNNYKEFVQNNQEIYANKIQEDLVYQALSKELGITIKQKDIEEYFALQMREEGYTYEDLKDIYGEELLYKSTLQDKVNQKLLKKFEDNNK